MFTHLHTHTEYSLLDGLSRINPMIQQCSALGMDALAITDHGAMYGVVDFYSEAKQQGIKPIIGCEVYVAMGDHRSKEPSERSPYHLTLIAKDNAGYKNLIQLVSKAHLEGFYYRPRVDKQLLEEHAQGIIALSGCLNGEIPRMIQSGQTENARDTGLWFKEVFGKDFYFEIQRHPGLSEQEIVNAELLNLSRNLDIPLAATNDFHYVLKEEAPLQDILICIHTNTTIHDEKRLRMHGNSYHLKSPQEMIELFPEAPQAISNTQLIAQMCNVELGFDQIYLPDYKTPGDENADVYLSNLCSRGLQDRLPGSPARYQQRLQFELEIIRQTRFANYFLVVWDIISFARANGVLYGVRGSAAASLVLYCLGVTDVDPLEYNLVFERFLNAERKEMPDIDMDFQDDRRDEVIRHVVNTYGKDHVAQIITFGTMGPKAAIRDAARALAIPYADADRIARLIPVRAHSLTEAESITPQLKDLNNVESGLSNLMETAKQIEGMVRHVSTHAAGVVISQEPLTEYVPLQRPARGEESEISMTQFPMAPIAKLGLLKMDFLGLANFTILKKTIDLVNERRGKSLGLRSISLDDQKTFELLASGETADIFQLEGEGMRKNIRELKPSSLAEVAAMIALYRPGPMEHIDTYIQAKHKRIDVQYPHSSLKDLLEETYGVIVYQDQVLRIAQKFAGYSLGEADIVRKAMGKKVPEIMREERERFISGAISQGYDVGDAENVFDLIEPFAGYAFNKAHAVSYALIAYWTAYFKANFELEFMTAVLNTRMGNMDKINGVVSECRRLSIPILPPDINKSRAEFTIEPIDSGGFGIRFGLAAIKNVGANAIIPIVESRERVGEFLSVEDLCRKVDIRGLNKRTLESLIKVGALESIEADRGKLLGGVERIVNVAQREARLRQSGQITMFDLFGTEVSIPINPLELSPSEPITETEISQWERELLGVSLKQDPILATLAAKRPKDAFLSVKEIEDARQRSSAQVVGQVASMRTGLTRQGKHFVSVNLTLMDGSLEVVAWPEVYERTQAIWREGALLHVIGKIRVREERVSLVCDQVKIYTIDDEIATKKKETATLRLSLWETADPELDTERLRKAMTLLLSYQGEDQVLLEVHTPDQTVVMRTRDTTSICKDLREGLEELLGSSSVRVEGPAIL
ncbi:DNA polymerase III subunit alpha [SAR202 cluster bacterium AD-802-E10_MRT_200m]|nr:DNA polymerase III subunit alpha [SAR202 cluster bacterium AD-802-E10_MRT_200m]